MFSSGRSRDTATSTVTCLCEQCLPMVLRYVACRVDDTGVAEGLTISIIKAAINEQMCYDAERKIIIAVFTEARKQVRKFGAGDTKFAGLSAEENEMLALRLAAKLPSDVVGTLTGRSEAEVKTIVRCALETLRITGGICPCED